MSATRRDDTRAGRSRRALESGGGGMWATVRGLNAAGAVVKLELEAEHGPLQVELGRERYEALRPQLGERLFVRPQKVRVFVNPQ